MKKVFIILTKSEQTYLIGYTTNLRRFVTKFHPNLSEMQSLSENEIVAYSPGQKQDVIYYSELIFDDEKCFMIKI